MDNKDQEKFTLNDLWEMVKFSAYYAIIITLGLIALGVILSVFGYFLLAGYYLVQVIIGLIVVAALFGWIFY